MYKLNINTLKVEAYSGKDMFYYDTEQGVEKEISLSMGYHYIEPDNFIMYFKNKTEKTRVTRILMLLLLIKEIDIAGKINEFKIYSSESEIGKSGFVTVNSTKAPYFRTYFGIQKKEVVIREIKTDAQYWEHTDQAIKYARHLEEYTDLYKEFVEEVNNDVIDLVDRIKLHYKS
jgi:hypothetical protein